MFTDWAAKYSKKHSLAQTDDFERFHTHARQSLANYWERKSDKKLAIFPYSCKLMDLYTKHIVWHRRGISEPQRKRLLRVAFRPLDSYSLLLLDKLGIRQRSGKKIPANAAMELVRTKKEYDFFQENIREICDDAGVPNFAFDYFAWNAES